MTTSLQSALAQISEEFSQKVFDVIRTAFVAELSNVTLSLGAGSAARPRAAAPRALASAAKATGAKSAAPKVAPKSGRLERRSSASIAKALDGIAALLMKTPGIGSEEIQKTLGLARNEIARPISIGLATKVLRKEGEKRATKYFAAGATKSADAGSAKKVAKKAVVAKKAPKKPAKKTSETAAAAI